jgi:hypothetical protein
MTEIITFSVRLLYQVPRQFSQKTSKWFLSPTIKIVFVSTNALASLC